MIYNPGDIIDRFCIALLKQKNIRMPQSAQEVIYYSPGYDEILEQFPQINWKSIKQEMLNYHSIIWELESDLRKGALDHDLEECGRRAIEIRKWNKKRILLKNKINKLTGWGLEDVRKNHLSA